ncbi:DUF2982 domain-containing protein [Thalassotalea sp. PS06]|uniref:DUF2982 domain-containing protein n=1 Tax=Thalassotalea sp. PS06 TaxID=2594005 RepID=UPI00116223C0|nr:DUF2982 domain-containing protein [Thalassotalea sp. PS06]QDP01398.1 DUF2982 domain-containing protein [Thalassotalea sp. PS06]
MKNATNISNKNIRAINKRNGLFLTLLGTVLLLIMLLIGQYWWQSLKIQMIFLYMASFVVFFIGILKLREPDYSYQLDSKGLTHTHRCGRWQIDWRNIQRVGAVKPDMSTMDKRLSYTGIKLKDIRPLAETISPRLANRLLHEQKPLLIVALKHDQLNMKQAIIDFEPFKLDGKIYKGPLAAFLHRTQALDKAYGFHLFLADDTLDRHPDEFIELLKRHIEKYSP